MLAPDFTKGYPGFSGIAAPQGVRVASSIDRMINRKESETVFGAAKRYKPLSHVTMGSGKIAPGQYCREGYILVLITEFLTVVRIQFN